MYLCPPAGDSPANKKAHHFCFPQNAQKERRNSQRKIFSANSAGFHLRVLREIPGILIGFFGSQIKKSCHLGQDLFLSEFSPFYLAIILLFFLFFFISSSCFFCVSVNPAMNASLFFCFSSCIICFFCSRV